MESLSALEQTDDWWTPRRHPESEPATHVTDARRYSDRLATV